MLVDRTSSLCSESFQISVSFLNVRELAICRSVNHQWKERVGRAKFYLDLLRQANIRIKTKSDYASQVYRYIQRGHVSLSIVKAQFVFHYHVLYAEKLLMNPSQELNISPEIIHAKLLRAKFKVLNPKVLLDDDRAFDLLCEVEKYSYLLPKRALLPSPSYLKAILRAEKRTNELPSLVAFNIFRKSGDTDTILYQVLLHLNDPKLNELTGLQLFNILEKVSGSIEQNAKANLYKAQMRIKRRIPQISDDQAFHLLNKVVMNEKVSPRTRAEAKFYQALMKASKRFKRNSHEEVFQLFDAYIESDHALPEERAEAHIFQFLIKYNHPSFKKINDDQAFELLKKVFKDKQVSPKTRAQARIYQAVMKLDNRINSISDYRAQRILARVSEDPKIPLGTRIKAKGIEKSFISRLQQSSAAPSVPPDSESNCCSLM